MEMSALWGQSWRWNCSEVPPVCSATVPWPKGTGRGGGREETRKEAFCFLTAEQRKEISLESLRRETVDDLSVTFSHDDLLLILRVEEALTLTLTLTLMCPWSAVWWAGEKVNRLVAQLCLTLWPVYSSLPGSSIHGIPQARILEWAVISFSRGSSWPGVEPGSFALQEDSLPFEPPGKPLDEQVFENKYPNWSACCLALLPMLSTLFLGK